MKNTLICSFILLAAIITIAKHEQYTMAIFHGTWATIGLMVECYQYFKRKKILQMTNSNDTENNITK